ncbi:MAG: hypothetical protein WBM50_26560 [Acidimicrobiales bacterium]
MSQRSSGSWELRVSVGVHPETARRRYRTIAVRALEPRPSDELVALVATVRSDGGGGTGSTMSV